MVDALIYMFFVGFGACSGAACVFFISYKIWQRMKNKTARKRKGVAF